MSLSGTNLLNFTIYKAILLNYFRIPDYIPSKKMGQIARQHTVTEKWVDSAQQTLSVFAFEVKSHSGSQLAPLMSVDRCVESLYTFFRHLPLQEMARGQTV